MFSVHLSWRTLHFCLECSHAVPLAEIARSKEGLFLGEYEFMLILKAQAFTLEKKVLS